MSARSTRSLHARAATSRCYSPPGFLSESATPLSISRQDRALLQALSSRDSRLRSSADPSTADEAAPLGRDQDSRTTCSSPSPSPCLSRQHVGTEPNNRRLSAAETANELSSQLRRGRLAVDQGPRSTAVSATALPTLGPMGQATLLTLPRGGKQISLSARATHAPVALLHAPSQVSIPRRRRHYTSTKKEKNTQ